MSYLALSIGLSFSNYADACKETIESCTTRNDIVNTANPYHKAMDVKKYWASEKLDGIRAKWTGSELKTRTGKLIKAPSWFTDALPGIPIDGELWAGRSRFFVVQQTVLDSSPNDSAWREIKFMAFDLPNHGGTYKQRYQRLIDVIEDIGQKHIQYVEHYPIESRQTLSERLNQLTSSGGEGLMLRKIDSLYSVGRSNELLKLKLAQDAEGTIIGYKAGTGKYTGLMGSIQVRMKSGVEFYIGSGFTDKLRKSPPPIGTVITFKFNGYSHKGVPKFARYVRQRASN
ncbi:DNA ligase [Vibrio sp. S4M6]|uniref:DNA ligase n=1 Tax=Vibrio sinus TaxID=2946865 RepID=UPI00202A7D20|nr:DNA ligase [Vibrio sinus]MCL9783302.1 DNA ligase [Vibrio sinus]